MIIVVEFTVLNTVLILVISMSRVALNDKSVALIPHARGKQTIVRDQEMSGFFVMVGTRNKTYMVQGDLRSGTKRQTIRIKVGEAGQMTAREARAKARTLLGQITSGVDPRPKPEITQAPKKAVTSLRSAWGSYCESHMQRKGRSEKTIAGYRDHVERLLKDWLDLPLGSLGDDPSLVKDKHDALSKAHGPYMANVCMRTFRAIYNHARKADRSLPPENPAFAIDWNPERRRDTGMGPEDLASWCDQLRLLDNPLRRELHLFILLSGSRPEAIKCARVEHIDFRKRLLFIPSPKGGEQKAFFIPLSRQMIACLARAMKFGRMMHREAASEWVFPGESSSGHMCEHKEKRTLLSHWGNELRQTYRTMGQVAGINDVDMHLLMNHSLPGVNAGYITRAKLVSSHLRDAQQTLSDTLFKWLLGTTVTKAWPRMTARVVIDIDLPQKLHTQRGNASQKCSRNMAVFRPM